MESPISIPVENGFLNGQVFVPDGAVQWLCLICPPLFEERKTSALTLARLARALSNQTCATLRFDYRGTGDSSGNFADYALSDWIEDTRTARHWLTDKFSGLPVLIFGLRFGAVLATQAIQDNDQLLLWAPVTDGDDYLLGELRKKIMKEMLTFGSNRTTRAALLDQLAAGDSIDLDGYSLTPRQFEDIKTIHLTAEPLNVSNASTKIFAIGPSGRLSAPIKALAETLNSHGPVTTHTCKMQAFWNQIGQIDCSELIADTVAALTKDPAPPSLAGRTAPARDGTRVTSLEAALETRALIRCGRLRPAVGAARNRRKGFKSAAVRPAAAGRSRPHWQSRVSPHSDRGAAPSKCRSSEQPVRITSQEESLRGILHRPQTAPDSGLGIVFCHGWSGGRLGPHRMFVKTARRLARLGIASLRVDFRGRGESDDTGKTYGIHTMSQDTRAAIDFLVAETGVKTVGLLGICSGAKVAISTAVADPRVQGMALWSAEGLGALREASTNRKKTGTALKTYARKLLRPATWKKIIAGKVDTKSVRKAVLAHETRSDEEAVRETKILKAFATFKAPLLFIYGGNDPDTDLAGKNYETFCQANQQDYQSYVIPEANHSFYSLVWEDEVIKRTCDWLISRFLAK